MKHDDEQKIEPGSCVPQTTDEAVPEFVGEVIQGPRIGRFNCLDVILCDRTQCLFNILYEIDDGERDVCCRPNIEWDGVQCCSFDEYSDATELGEGQVMTEGTIPPWLTSSGRPEKEHKYNSPMYFINHVPVPKEAFDRVIERAIEYNAKLMAEDMNNRGPLPEDIDGSWIRNDLLLERDGRQKLLESNRELMESNQEKDLDPDE